MRNLINFILRYSPWMLLIVYVALSCMLLFRNNPYQQHVYLTSANSVAATTYGAASSVTGYFHLRDVNNDLQRRCIDLEIEVLELKRQLRQYRDSDYVAHQEIDSALARYSFNVAHVFNNSVNRPYNYVTLDKGELDGVHPEMGVIDQNGIVGIVNVTGPHSARVISLLNSHLRLSCKVKGYDHVGSLVWDGKNPSEALLEELPRHAVFEVGDTIITSGYSTVFPEGVPVGRVIKSLRDNDENFFTLRVELFTDFTTLGTVRIVDDHMRDELHEVERDIKTESKFGL